MSHLFYTLYHRANWCHCLCSHALEWLGFKFYTGRIDKLINFLSLRAQTYHNPEYKEHTPSHTMVQQNKLILINISFTCMHGSGYTVGFQTLAVMDLQWASISNHCKRSLTSQATSAHHGRFPYEHYQHFPGRQLNSTFFLFFLPFLLSTFFNQWELWKWVGIKLKCMVFLISPRHLMGTFAMECFFFPCTPQAPWDE